MYTKITVNNIYIAFISKWQDWKQHNFQTKSGDSFKKNYRLLI